MRNLSWTALAGLAAVCAIGTQAHAQAPNHLVISQVYSAGGNSGASMRYDYVQLYNPTNAAVDMTGWSLQYSPATNTAWTNKVNVPAATMVQPHRYFLIQCASGGTNGYDWGQSPLYADWNSGATINMAGGGGKIAIARVATTLATGCGDANIVDLCGYGTANCSEGSVAPAPTTTTALNRASGGCQDSNNNSSDFASLPTDSTHVPLNSTAPDYFCSPATNPSGSGSANPASQCPGSSVALAVDVTPGQNPVSTGIAVVADISQLTGTPGSTVTLSNGGSGTHYTGNATIDPFVCFAAKNVTVTITDAQSRTGIASITVTVANCNPHSFGNSTGTCNGEPVLLTATVTPGQQPASTGLSVTVNLGGIGGSSSQQMYDDATHGDLVAGDNIYSYAATIPFGTTAAVNTLGITITDAQGRSNTTNPGSCTVATENITVSNAECASSQSTVVISQIYGGGGNTGAPLRNDYFEIFNRSLAPVDISGWSIQYASAAGAAGFDGTANPPQKTDIPAGTVIFPGRYLLIQESQGANGAAPALPTPDVIGGTATGGPAGGILVAQSASRVALVSDGVMIGNNFSSPTVKDLVGVSNSAITYEGAFPALANSNTEAIFRRNGGCVDNDQNAADFYRAAPAPRNSATPANVCAPTCHGVCTADFDDGSGMGIPDGGVTIDDLLYYLTIFQQGVICADIDDGSGTGTQDQGVTIDDLLYFLARFAAGC